MQVKPLIKSTTELYLKSWYSNLFGELLYDKWVSTLSSKFQATNGVRQGGVLSPLLFDVYVNELSELLNKSAIRRNLGGTIIDHMLYADDICIVSLPLSCLHHLLNIRSDYCERHDLTFNDKTFMCI